MIVLIFLLGVILGAALGVLIESIMIACGSDDDGVEDDGNA